jgi:excisionase family DNA binding protein
MTELTVNEAAKLTNRSSRQVMRWLAGGKIKARKDNLNRWRIKLDSLDAVATIDKTALDALDRMISPSLLLARIESLEAMVKALQEKENRLPSYRPIETYIPPVPLPSLPRPLEATPRPAPVMSDAGELARYFARRHGVNSQTFMSQIEKNPSMVRSQRQGETDRFNHYVDPELRARVIAYWRQIGTRHARCEDILCPCYS